MDYDEKLKLAMLAGAYAIRNSRKFHNGMFAAFEGEITWLEAEKWLECTARGLNPEECEVTHE